MSAQVAVPIAAPAVRVLRGGKPAKDAVLEAAKSVAWARGDDHGRFDLSLVYCVPDWRDERYSLVIASTGSLAAFVRVPRRERCAWRKVKGGALEIVNFDKERAGWRAPDFSRMDENLKGATLPVRVTRADFALVARQAFASGRIVAKLEVRCDENGHGAIRLHNWTADARNGDDADDASDFDVSADSSAPGFLSIVRRRFGTAYLRDVATHAPKSCESVWLHFPGTDDKAALRVEADGLTCVLMPRAE